MSAPVSESPYTYDYEDRKNNGSDDGTYPKKQNLIAQVYLHWYLLLIKYMTKKWFRAIVVQIYLKIIEHIYQKKSKRNCGGKKEKFDTNMQR